MCGPVATTKTRPSESQSPFGSARSQLLRIRRPPALRIMNRLTQPPDSRRLPRQQTAVFVGASVSEHKDRHTSRLRLGQVADGQFGQGLTTETAAAGFSPDLKPFRAHVTVARKVAQARRGIDMRKVLWSFDAFALVESRTLPEGPVYSVVESFVLGSTEKVRT